MTTGSGGGGTTAGSGGSGSGGAGPGSGGRAGSGTGGTVVSAPDSCAASPTGSVAFSVPSRAFEGTLNVALSTTTPGAEIRYTTDRTAPTATSTLYEGTPIAVSSSTVLSARAFSGGTATGAVSTAVYVARSFDQAHDLPVVMLDSFGKPLPPGTSGAADEFMDTAFLLLAPPTAGTVSLSSTPTVASSAGYHVRGQSSANYDKKPFRIELRNSDGTDRDCPVLGMPAESDWVLHSPFPDKALIRNAFVYSLGPDIGIRAPRGVFVEVYLNTATRVMGSSDYQGVYLLVETIKNQKDRLNLKKLKETDTLLPALSGGYVFKFEWMVTDIQQRLMCPSGQANCWNFLEVADPDPWVPSQQDYLTQHIQAFVTALHSATPADTTSGYPAFIDSASFVNQVIVQELTRNLDAYTRSQYFYKDRDAKIFAGPLWDYDLTAGVGFGGNVMTTGWQYEASASRLNVTADWFPRLLADAAFKGQLVARWKALRQAQLSDGEIRARIARLTAPLTAGAQRNFERWPILTTARLGGFTTPTAATWGGQVAAMQDWLVARAAWLDTMWQ